MEYWMHDETGAIVESQLRPTSRHYNCTKAVLADQLAIATAHIYRMESALKVIHTWALFDIDNKASLALDPKDVAKLCEKAIRGDQ